MRSPLSTRLRPPAPGFDGLPRAPVEEIRMARIVTAVATIWFVACAVWELFGPILAGHYAAAAGNGIIAENMLRWEIAGPVWEYTAARPTPASYYCHHPWGVFWTTALFFEVFGRHDFVCRLPAVLLSGLTPVLLHALGRALWRPIAGAVAAVAFVVLPITLSFAHFNALEVPLIAYTTLALWGSVRYLQTGGKAHFTVAGAGALLSLHTDWPALVWIGTMLVVLGARVIGRWRGGGAAHTVRRARLWVLLAGTAALTVALYLVIFHSAGKLGELASIASMRAAGNEAPLWDVLASRRYWLELSFTPVAIALGLLGAVLCLVRAAALRRETELVPLYVLAMSSFQYFVFRQGADIHVFWPHVFGAFFALAMGAMAATIAGLLEDRRSPWRASVWALAVSALPCLVILRDAIPTLAYARETGGRFNEKGLLIHTDGAKTAFLRHLAAETRPDRVVDLSTSMKPTWAQVWALGGRIVRPNRPPPHTRASASGRGAVYLADTRFLDDAQAGSLAARYGITAVGPFWAADPGAPAAPIEGYRLAEREPSLFEWYFTSGTEPVRTVVADPYWTWELRTHFDQDRELPQGSPVTFEDRRIAHNMAVEAGDPDKARAILVGLEAEWRAIGVRFEDGTELLGVTFEPGVRPLLTAYFRAAGPSARGVRVGARATVVERAWLSSTMPDPTVREIGIPMAIGSERWRTGFIYADPIPIRERLGTELIEIVVRDRTGALVRRDDGEGAATAVLRY